MLSAISLFSLENVPRGRVYMAVGGYTVRPSEGILMLELVTDLIGLPVYTKEGIYLGDVNNVVLDITNNKINGLFVSNTNPTLVEESANLNIPFRWVQAVGDIISLKYFPPRVTLRRESPDGEEYEKYKW